MNNSVELQDLPETQVDDSFVEFEEITYRYAITSYGADYPVDSLIKRMKDGVVYVPDFQRSYVWNVAQASKFIESLVLGLPVPGIFLSRENTSGRLLIVDGQQRLMSLFHFYEGLFKGKDFTLTGLNSDLNGRNYKTLNGSDRIRLDDSIIHATIVRQDHPDDHESSIYLIFERLNTGGKPLTPQEIRACIYYGEFNRFLSELKQLPQWRWIFGKVNDRMKEEELFLRFFSLLLDRDRYEKPLKGFMNKFMNSNRNFERYSRQILYDLFLNTINVFAESLGNKAFRVEGPFNAAAFEALMIGVAERLRSGPINLDFFKEAYDSLIVHTRFIEATQGATSDDKKLRDRIEMSVVKFETI